ncbi:branched-chain amino acid ABC transporter permease [Rhodobacteraceae bacterium nBUS_24]|jgi:branched-chain amino acid transport system permease protein|nr:branched-chain amino acid ABC transporter permease [Marinovum sp.]MDG1424144.1 branched-chain amino acid ABC transporter permease [Paracoccaceae bacterium]MBT4873183.1 branched-chain amino acid ABC transporter permease [Marinovum sp.]MBT6099334.1 branched-chain amino acid ABC transporter permease [Marinovum sp.]MBT6506902.1 branched-chain amino acid ABC transporter permease [Marinovum sp.]
MFYREAGQFKATYQEDLQAFPIRQDKIGIGIWLAIAYLYIPFFGIPGLEYGFALNAIMIPVLIFTITTIGLNILVGFTGQISLGTGAFMGVGAYSCYKLTSYFPDTNIIVLILASGFVAAAVGALFGLPSLRIKGFYLVVATLAAQFFLEWCFIRIGWLYNFNPSGAIEVPQREVFGVIVTGAAAEPATRYLVVLTILVFLTVIAGNIVRGRIGRSWMMIRDMDIAAELIGVRPLRAKLSAFAVSSYYCGVSGALMVFLWLGAAEVESFDVNHSFLYLFMVILGGLGSITGSYMGAAFIWTFPIILKEVGKRVFDINPIVMENVSLVAIGVMIVFILIKEPHGLARLWQLVKQKLRIWPFPH